MSPGHHQQRAGEQPPPPTIAKRERRRLAGGEAMAALAACHPCLVTNAPPRSIPGRAPRRCPTPPPPRKMPLGSPAFPATPAGAAPVGAAGSGGGSGVEPKHCARPLAFLHAAEMTGRHRGRPASLQPSGAFRRHPVSELRFPASFRLRPVQGRNGRIGPKDPNVAGVGRSTKRVHGERSASPRWTPGPLTRPVEQPEPRRTSNRPQR